MDLRRYVDDIQRQLLAAAEAGGDDARALAQRLVAPLDAAIRLALQDALALAAEEITCELAPGSVELRLRGGELVFAVSSPADRATDAVVDDAGEIPDVRPTPGGAPLDSSDTDDGGVARINVRMPESLKARVEQAAAGEGLSVNTWLVRAAAAAVERADPGRRAGRKGSRGTQQYTGWAR